MAGSRSRDDSQLSAATDTQRSADSQPDIDSIRLRNIVITVNCTQCWAYKSRECVIFPQGDGPFPLHFARYEVARRNNLITYEELEAANKYRGDRGFVYWPTSVEPEPQEKERKDQSQ